MLACCVANLFLMAPFSVAMAQEDGATAVMSTRDMLQGLMGLPMDAPEIVDFTRNASPAEAVAAAAALSREGRDSAAPLITYLHGLAALLEQDAVGNRALLGEAYSALDQNFFPPVILGAIDQILADLEKERSNLDRRASLYAVGNGLPLPRKYVLDNETGKLSLFQYEQYAVKRKTLAANEVELGKLKARYPWLMLDLGAFYTDKNNQVLAYDCFARSMKLDFEGWKSHATMYNEDFLLAASFMILSAHRTDDVLALYNQVPLQPEPLQRRVVEQIEFRTRIYGKAADQYTNHASINQALRDLLYTLIEDQGAVDFLPEDDRRRFLEEIGRTAITKRHFQEAIGVYASLGDKKKLIELGDKLSNSVFVVRNGVAYVNRDLAGAIDAYWEAEAYDKLQDLRTRVAEAQVELGKGRYRVDDATLLPAYVSKLDTYLQGGHGQKDALVELGGGMTIEKEAKKPGLTASSPAELITLVTDLGRQVQTAVPGQDITLAQTQLVELGGQAEKMGLPDVAIQAYRLGGNDGKVKLTALGDRLAAQSQYAKARVCYQASGRPDKLKMMAQQILGQGIVTRGVFNPMVPEAIEALIAADAVDQVEGVLGQLLRFKVQLSAANLQGDGGAQSQQTLADVEKAIKRIQEEYEMVP